LCRFRYDASGWRLLFSRRFISGNDFCVSLKKAVQATLRV